MRPYAKTVDWCMLMFVMSVALAFGGCAKKKLAVPDSYTEASLAPYVEEFLAEARARNIEIDDGTQNSLRIVKFVDDIAAERRKYGQNPGDENLAGACTNVQVKDALDVGVGKLRKEQVSWKEVWIAQEMNPSRFPDKRGIVLREVVYHELGHCLLGLEHAAQTPHHIMSPAVSGDAQYLTKNWDQLMTDLFGARQVLARVHTR